MGPERDYYSTLSSSIAALEENCAETRREVYHLARIALIHQLEELDPRCSVEEAAKEKSALMDAIRRIEAESSARDQVQEREAKDEPRTTEAPHSTAANHDMSLRCPPSPDSMEEPAREGIVTAGAFSPMGPEANWMDSAADTSDRRAVDDDVRPLGADQDLLSASGNRPIAVEQQAPEKPVARSSRLNAARFWSRNNQSDAAWSRIKPEVRYPIAEESAVRSRRPRRPAGGPIFGTIFGRLVMALVMLGTGVAVNAYLTGHLKPEWLPNPAQLISGPGNEITTTPIREVVNAGPAALAPSGGPSLAQKAVLYDEDSINPMGSTTVGSAVWRDATEANNGAVIVLDVDIPAKQLVLTMSIRRDTNRDSNISHLIEFKFHPSAKLSAGAVSDVLGILMKDTERSKGTRLSGEVTKVIPGFFLYGLSRADADKNLRLIRERGWLDIPIAFQDRARRILTIEKGSTGEPAINEALDAWNADLKVDSAPSRRPRN